MAFRIEKAISAFLILGGVAFAQPFNYEVRHQHLHGGALGTLRVEKNSIAFDEKKGKHCREWKFSDIQQLSLSPQHLRILTYEDRKWQLGRDREYIFDRLPDNLVRDLYPLFQQHLDQRLVAEVAQPTATSLWQIPVKLRRGLGGSEGTLVVSAESIAYQSNAPEKSRTWRLQDIENISSAGPFDLTITTMEKAGWLHAGPGEFRFQLKVALNENRFNELWRRIYRNK